MPQTDPLDIFHPIIRQWFHDRVGTPTDIQSMAWPRIAAGEHVLVSAPTGSGKTLTAFLWALQQLLTGAWPATGRSGERTGPRVLYMSPLRALNTDVRNNLERPLAELTERFHAAGLEPPEVRAMTRSGDTPQGERQKMLRRPPAILITTPESLNILLTSEGGRRLLHDLETVILDEIHAVVPSKRGTHLITAVERLATLSGEFQRLALSATVNPLDTVADFVGGYEIQDVAGDVTFRKRRVSVVRSAAAKRYDVKVRWMPASLAEDDGVAAPVGERLDDTFWQRMTDDLRRVIQANRSTLVFANSRRLTERVTRQVNEGQLDELAYSHHGSLSREVRSVVERRLKGGELKAIIATSSLELGIDIGALDQVVLVQTPRSVASAVQRVGRAGHGVGEVSRGLLCPTHGRDLLDAAVVTQGIATQRIEETRPLEGPLDVLAQVILSMTVSETWPLDELYAQVRASYPYRQLGRKAFDRVIDMLAGRYADSRLKDLKPRISVDRVQGTARARPGAARLIYMSGGTIADRGYFNLRREDTQTKLGELDEEFVWERSIGDAFTLGAQSWQVRKVTHNDVLVMPARGGAGLAPFWRSDAEDKSFDFSQRVGRLLAFAEPQLSSDALEETLRTEHGFESDAAAELVAYLRSQASATGRLPNHERVLVERCPAVIAGREQRQIILHTCWGGTVNRPFAIALQGAWEERFGESLEVFHDDDAILLRPTRDLDADALMGLVDPAHLESLLRQRLESTGFFGSRFRVNAAIALLLPKAGFKTRTPLWMSRQRAKNLLETVRRYGDFPVMVETWRTCLRDDFDLPNLDRQLRRVRDGELPLVEVHTDTPSPFAAGLLWRHTNHYMYEDDTPDGGRPSNLRRDVLRELVFSSHLRPRLPRDLVEGFRRKVQRVAEGYAPHPGDDLRDWLLERGLIEIDEWWELLRAVVRDHPGPDLDPGGRALAAEIADRAVLVILPGAETPAAVALDALPRLLRAVTVSGAVTVPGTMTDTATGHGPELPTEAHLASIADSEAPPSPIALAGLRTLLERDPGDATDDGDGESPTDSLVEVVAEWLRFQGPVEPSRLAALFGLDDTRLARLLGDLEESQLAVVDTLRRDADAEVCESDNLETLLRWLRTDVRPSFEARPAEELPLFLAQHQGLVRRGDGVEALQERLEQLFGLPLPAPLWEEEVLPARLDPYYPAWLDAAMQESDLCWLGCGDKRLTFVFEGDLEIVQEPPPVAPPEASSEEASTSNNIPSNKDIDLLKLLRSSGGRFDLGQLADRSGLSTGQASDGLWGLAWDGWVTNDTFLAVRKGLATGFKPEASKPPSARAGRRGSRRAPSLRAGRRAAERWGASRAFFGHWRALPQVAEPLDALDAEELVKDRVRQLLGRHGILCRELLQREVPALRWGRVFRTLRLMELSGEVLAGQFFQGLQGLQFLAPSAFRELKRGLGRDTVFWLCAADPASLCGVVVQGLDGLPRRLPSAHLVYHGTRLVMVSQRRGKALDFHVPAEHPELTRYLGPLAHLLTRHVEPLASIDIATVNGEPAPTSPFIDRLAEVFKVTREPKSVKLWRRY